MEAALTFLLRFLPLIPGLISVGRNIAEDIGWVLGVIRGAQSSNGTISNEDWEKLDQLEQEASDRFDEAAKPQP